MVDHFIIKGNIATHPLKLYSWNRIVSLQGNRKCKEYFFSLKKYMLVKNNDTAQERQFQILYWFVKMCQVKASLKKHAIEHMGS